MNNFIFDIMVVIIPLLVLCIIVFTFALMFNPKLRGKFMSNQIFPCVDGYKKSILPKLKELLKEECIEKTYKKMERE